MTSLPETTERSASGAEADALTIRECVSVEELDACVRLQREAFGLPDLELSPRRHLVVARAAGGWVLGAFDGDALVGFVLHLAAARGAEVIGYSHMMAVAPGQQNRGVGARLKWAQREHALAEGRRLIRWTWEPMRARNAHFNLNRLGVVVRAYAADFYGTDYAATPEEQGARRGLASDRLSAEWELRSPRVEALARGQQPASPGAPAAAVEIPPDWNALVRQDPAAARRELLRAREGFQRAFADGLVCAGFERHDARPRYLFYRES